jgi:HK97 family phage portal protein
MTHVGTQREPHFGASAPARPRASTTVLSSDPNVTDFFGLVPTPTGRAVTEQSAMQVSAVAACVRVIAGAIASLPVDFYARDVAAGSVRKKNEADALWWLFNEEPSARWTAAAFWEYVAKSELMRGDAFAWIHRDGYGNVKSIEPINPGGVTVEVVNGRLRYYFFDELNRARGLDQDDMLHFPGFGFDGKRGMSAIAWGARQGIGIALATDEYAARFFGSGALAKHVITAPGEMTPEQTTMLRDQWAQRYAGLDNAWKPMILTEGLKVEELTLTAEDSQLLESRKFQVIDIARAFGVPPFMIGETEKTTSWGNGIEHMSLGFVKYTLQRRLTAYAQEINRKIFRTAARFVKFDLDELLRGDSAARAKFIRDLVGGSQGPGIITINEARAREGFEPIAGGEALFSPSKTDTQGAPANAQ